MESLESSLKSLVTRVLERTDAAAAAEFRKGGDRIVHEALKTDPATLRQRLLETEPAPKKSVRTRGGEILLGFESISVAVTMTSILVHLWHERMTIKLVRAEETACQRLKVVWEELLIRRGIDPVEAHRIAAEFGEDAGDLFVKEPSGK
jgi:hypothetical protein